MQPTVAGRRIPDANVSPPEAAGQPSGRPTTDHTREGQGLPKTRPRPRGGRPACTGGRGGRPRPRPAAPPPRRPAATRRSAARRPPWGSITGRTLCSVLSSSRSLRSCTAEPSRAAARGERWQVVDGVRAAFCAIRAHSAASGRQMWPCSARDRSRSSSRRAPATGARHGEGPRRARMRRAGTRAPAPPALA